MGRKNRLTSKKNYERRKRNSSISSSTSEICSETGATTNTADYIESSADDELSDLTLMSPPFFSAAQVPSSSLLEQLHSSLTLPSRSWTDQSPTDLSRLLLCKISEPRPSTSSATYTLTVSHCLTVHADLTWSLSANQHHVDPLKSTALRTIPTTLTHHTFLQLLHILDCSDVCVGQHDAHFVKMVKAKKGKILSKDGKVTAFLDESAGTVRTNDCELISLHSRCDPCKLYRANLRTMYNRWNKRLATSSLQSDSSSHTNDRYLSTPEKKAKVVALRKRVHSAEESVKRLKTKVMKLTEEQGTVVDEGFHTDLLNIMQNSDDQIKQSYSEGSFARLFWDEQLKAASAKDSRLVRWHPVIIKWCLNLKLLSSSAYHAMRTSGFMKLPSERTLRDYVHYTSNKPGFQDTVHQQLLQEVDSRDLPCHRRYVSLILDEMKIKEGLVYNKYTGEIIGFTHLGDINDELLKLEQGPDHPPVATHTLALMVRGLLFKMEFPYAHFSTNGVTAESLCPIIWEAVRNLEMSALRVLCIVADGASANRKFFRMHSTDHKHKTINPYSQDSRWIYFIVDPPHLIKTVRNCWSHSGSNGTRRMTINGQFIEWKQLWDVYHKVSTMATDSMGLTIAPKLKLEHLKLTSFSRMRVDLAAQVLSKTVADVFAYIGDESTRETQKFILMFDKLFDCLNVRDGNQWQQKRKPDLKPYSTMDDERFTWLEETFLRYLDEWESAVMNRDDLSGAAKLKLLLSRETREGLHITVKSFVELTKYILSQDSDSFFLSERISQDPLENYFGKQRARGGRNENPTIQQCLHNAAAIRIQKSLATNPIRGNCRKREEDPEVMDETPLPKRKRRKIA